ncbi:MAG: cation transporter [Candidatus Nezhaarchaeota archaeon]|nr:cation transporter [Candidatus Nezhaarchaeota archaeon]MCX8142595.1 cation transporter [Candidatus Nezhaarchaeota archaeon]
MDLRYRLRKGRRALTISVLLSSLGVVVEGVMLSFFGSIILATDFFHWVLDTIVGVVLLFSVHYASRIGRRFPWSVMMIEITTGLMVMMVILNIYGFIFFNYINSIMTRYGVSTESLLAAVATIVGGIITLTVFVIQAKNYRRYRLEILKIDRNHALIDTVASFIATIGIATTFWSKSPAIEVFITLILIMFIIHSVVELLRDTLRVLSGSNLDHEMSDRVKSVVEGRLPDVKLKNVEARKIGSFYIVSVNAFLSPHTTILKAHLLRRRIVNIVKRVSDLIYHIDVRFYPSPEYKGFSRKSWRRTVRGLRSMG